MLNLLISHVTEATPLLGIIICALWDLSGKIRVPNVKSLTLLVLEIYIRKYAKF